MIPGRALVGCRTAPPTTFPASPQNKKSPGRAEARPGIGGGSVVESTQPTSSIILNIGMNIEITMNPTTTPRKTISSGSIIDVSPDTAASTWSS